MKTAELIGWVQRSMC